MKNYTLLTPEQAGYYDDPILDEILSEIQTKIQLREFRLKPKEAWKSKLLVVNTIVQKFGWTINTFWVGTRDDGYTSWMLKPLKK